jgi:SAM-dependent methyltransferase
VASTSQLPFTVPSDYSSAGQSGVVARAGPEDAWSSLADRFVDKHYGSLRGRVRTRIVHQHLLAHLAPPPLHIVDVGGGAGHQSIPLAREGYDVTIVEPSASMLERAEQLIAAEADAVAGRVRLLEAPGEQAPAALDGRRYGGVLCHGVLPYLDDPTPLVDSLCALADRNGLVSIVAKNVEALAMRPALEGDWAAALSAFTANRQINGLGVETRGDDIDELSAMLAVRNVNPLRLVWRTSVYRWLDTRAPRQGLRGSRLRCGT